MILTDVMDELATQLDTITGLRTHAFPPDGATAPPVAFPGYPEFDFDGTYVRGMDQWTMPVYVVVGMPNDRAARERIGPFISGSGSSSIKQVLEAGTYAAFDSLRVMSGVVEVIDIAGTSYLAGVFQVDVVGSGS